MLPTLSTSPIIWLDLEFTDLNVKTGQIVEIATILTDAQLNIIAEGPDLVIHQPNNILQSMVDWNKQHFAESGLLTEIVESEITVEEAEEKTLRFLKKHCTAQSSLLAGASVYVDREFLEFHMPKLYNFLHYRIIDTNTLRELSTRWYPSLERYPKMETHRAHDDILESINELKYYQQEIFK